MIEFHKLTLDDRDWMRQAFQEDDNNACEYTFANNFMWRNVYHVEVAKSHGCAIARFDGEDGEKVYSYPIGKGNKEAVIAELLLECQSEGRVLEMSPLSEEARDQLNQWFPGQFCINSNRADSDYIYTVEKLSKLSGKKLASKRNHIARFKDDDDWVYEPITPDNKEECRNMTYHWISMRQEKWNSEMEAEMSVVHEAFDNFEALGLMGGLLRKAGKIVAFTLGEPLNSDTFVVHFEKAFPEVQGAYPMINQQFVLQACQDYTYVNREEDTGDLGLRKAKLSYRPDILLRKFVARSSDVVFADPKRDRDGIQKIWNTCFGDEEEYIDYYIENRMNKENMLVIYQDGELAAMASFLPAEYVRSEPEAPQEIRYVYAVATLPKYRGQGLATKILEYGANLWKVPLALCPAEEGLCEFYGKMGFVKAFLDRTQNFQQKDLTTQEVSESEFTFSEIGEKEYRKLRDQNLMKPGYVRWDEDAIQYAINLNSFLGGKTVAVKKMDLEDQLEDCQCAEGALMYYVSDQKLHILETTLSSCCLERVIPELMRENDVREAKLQVPQGMLLFPSETTHFPLEKEGYLNLTLG